MTKINDGGPELKPCPFCGPSVRKPVLHKGKGVKCHTCGAWGPAWEKPDGSEWNRRADLVPAPGWQPIETAPRYEDILIYEDGAVTKARVTCVGDDWCWELDCTQPVVYSPAPTHWMPLPAPPSEDKQ